MPERANQAREGAKEAAYHQEVDSLTEQAAAAAAATEEPRNISDPFSVAGGSSFRLGKKFFVLFGLCELLRSILSRSLRSHTERENSV